jgi:hypothetical protein
MNHLRQLDIIDPALLDIPIHIIGCGSVGSWTALTLAKVGASRLVLWDFDIVEGHNIPNQAYRPADLGRPKVEAMADIVEAMTDESVRIQNRRFDGFVDQGVVILAVDSMTARIDLWRALRDQSVDWLIDSRMGAEVARILTVRISSLSAQRDYGRTLYRSTEALQEPCTARSTAYCATGLASFITAKVVKLVTGRPFSPGLTIDFRNALLLGGQAEESIASA